MTPFDTGAADVSSAADGFPCDGNIGRGGAVAPWYGIGATSK